MLIFQSRNELAAHLLPILKKVSFPITKLSLLLKNIEDEIFVNTADYSCESNKTTSNINLSTNSLLIFENAWSMTRSTFKKEEKELYQKTLTEFSYASNNNNNNSSADSKPKSIIKLFKNLCIEGGSELKFNVDCNLEYLMAEFWDHAVPVYFNATDKSPSWCLEPIIFRKMRHSDDPNLKWFHLEAFKFGNQEFRNGLTVTWTVKPITVGMEIIRDFLPEYIVSRGTLQRSARLICLNHYSELLKFASSEEYNTHLQIFDYYQSYQALAGVGESIKTPPFKQEHQLRNTSETRKNAKLKLFSDVVEVKKVYDVKAKNPNRDFDLVEDQDEADIWHLQSQIQNFPQLDKSSVKYVNQFPYEGSFVRKDLLPQTVRRLCYESNSAPNWWLPAYDLSTELIHFEKDFKKRQQANENNTWVIKPAQGTHSDGIIVADNMSLVVRAMALGGGDRVVQKYIDNPLLIPYHNANESETVNNNNKDNNDNDNNNNNKRQGHKFDVRSYFLVKTLYPTVSGVLFKPYHARVAAKSFSLSPESLSDFDTHLTVTQYNKDSIVHQNGGNVFLNRRALIEKFSSTPTPPSIATTTNTADNNNTNADTTATTATTTTTTTATSTTSSTKTSSLEDSSAPNTTATMSTGGPSSSSFPASSFSLEPFSISLETWEEEIDGKFEKLVKELFSGIGFQVGSWEKCRAIYGIDWMINVESRDNKTVFEPKLLEINYCPDLVGVQGIYPNVSAYVANDQDPNNNGIDLSDSPIAHMMKYLYDDTYEIDDDIFVKV